MPYPLISVTQNADPEEWEEILRAAKTMGTPGLISRTTLGRIYSPLINMAAAGRPLVFAQLGQSLDGRIASASGKSHFINSKAAICHLHRLRALADAVVIGVGTALADDPQLTVREAVGASPARVILDPRGRLPATARCLVDDGTRRIVLQGRDVARPHGVEAVVLPCPDGRMDPQSIVTTLGALGFRRILIEGGADTVSRFLDSGRLDRLHLLIAPMIIGSGPTGLSLTPIDELADARRPVHEIYRFNDGDLLIDCNLNEIAGAP